MNRVTLPYNTDWAALSWAKKHCASYITNRIAPLNPGQLQGVTIDYFFNEAQDATWFTLRWSGT